MVRITVYLQLCSEKQLQSNYLRTILESIYL